MRLSRLPLLLTLLSVTFVLSLFGTANAGLFGNRSSQVVKQKSVVKNRGGGLFNGGAQNVQAVQSLQSGHSSVQNIQASSYSHNVQNVQSVRALNHGYSQNLVVRNQLLARPQRQLLLNQVNTLSTPYAAAANATYQASDVEYVTAPLAVVQQYVQAPATVVQRQTTTTTTTCEPAVVDQSVNYLTIPGYNLGLIQQNRLFSQQHCE